MNPALALLGITFFLIGGVAGTNGPNRYGPDPRDEDQGEMPDTLGIDQTKF